MKGKIRSEFLVCFVTLILRRNQLFHINSFQKFMDNELYIVLSSLLLALSTNLSKPLNLTC